MSEKRLGFSQNVEKSTTEGFQRIVCVQAVASECCLFHGICGSLWSLLKFPLGPRWAAMPNRFISASAGAKEMLYGAV